MTKTLHQKFYIKHHRKYFDVDVDVNIIYDVCQWLERQGATFSQIRRNVMTERQNRRLTGRWRVKKWKSTFDGDIRRELFQNRQKVNRQFQKFGSADDYKQTILISTAFGGIFLDVVELSFFRTNFILFI